MSNLSLGYLRLRTPNLEAWETFAADVLGFMPTGGPDEESRYYRVDDHPYRLQLVPGDGVAIEAVGWEAADDLAFDAAVARLEDAGVAVTRGTQEEAAARLVSGFASFSDPAGAPIEVFWGPVFDHERVVTPLVSGFVTGEMGFGHVVTSVEDLQGAIDFYRDNLGFHLRNTWDVGVMEMAFLSPNPRHHSVAFGAGMPGPNLLRHFMVEAATLDDVGYAQDRCIDNGVPVIMGLGRHTNDNMISFYCETPDGFLVEFGWGGAADRGPGRRADVPDHETERVGPSAGPDQARPSLTTWSTTQRSAAASAGSLGIPSQGGPIRSCPPSPGRTWSSCCSTISDSATSVRTARRSRRRTSTAWPTQGSASRTTTRARSARRLAPPC